MSTKIIFMSYDCDALENSEALYSIPGLNTIAPFGSVRWGVYEIYTTQSLLRKNDYPLGYIVKNKNEIISVLIYKKSYFKEHSCISNLLLLMNSEEREQFYENLPEITEILKW